MTPNDTTNSLTTRIIFGKEKKPELVYTDLSIEFPGYEFVRGDDGKYHNLYRGTDLGFGGYVYAEPGMYGDVALLDVASLHPHSIIAMNCFGAYTSRFKALMDTRLHIKHKDYEAARKLFDGRLEPYLEDESTAKALSQALKIAINSVYGLTSASFPNPFRDERNVNNIVALRGALFMRTLQDEVQKLGFKVAHIKTDSIKIPDATPEIIEFCMAFAKKYGYEFEHEDTYDRICLVNNAVYIAKAKDGHWTATGAEFQHPYIFKKLFSGEELEFKDFCETKAVSKGDIFMDFDESLPEGEHNMQFVGRVGSFVPVKPGVGGAILYRHCDGKNHSIPGTLLKEKSKTVKVYRWLEAEVFDESMYDDIDMTYFDKMAEDARHSIMVYGDFKWFVSDDPYVGPEFVPGEEMSYPVYPDDIPFNED